MPHRFTPKPDIESENGIEVVTAADLPTRDPAGRFVAKPEPSMIPEMGAGLAQALLDADAEAWRTENARTHAERLSSALEFGDRITAAGS